jgi:transcriptional regulator with XRE-family HTH domain
VTGEELKEIRARLGWSQQETSDRLGLSVRTIKYYEAGTIPIPGPAAKLIGLLAGER